MGILIGDQSFRGSGVASEVLTELSLTLKEFGITKMVLGVENEHTSAIRSYEKIGFKATGPQFINFKEKDHSVEMIGDL